MSEKLTAEEEKEREHREELRNVLIDVTNEFLKKHQAEIVAMAEARIKFLKEMTKQ